ncbi:MAG: anti-sigma regulatory factor [Bacteroidales bacterium]|nr:anti-sigma regulatory factor [Bacteroidales bacterium]
MNFNFKINGGDFSGAGRASSDIKKVLKKLNVHPKIIKRIVVALYEAEVNVVAHAKKGSINAEIDSEKIRITVVDEGPGIPDIKKAMTEGFSTASSKVREMGFGAGMGLPNMKKNADVLNIKSNVGSGTMVELITFFKS